MTVNTEILSVAYAGDGVTTLYAWPAELFEVESLAIVQVVDSIDNSGAITPLILNVDYTIALSGDFSTANVTVPGSTPLLSTITLARDNVLTQEDTYTDGDAFPSVVHQNGRDRAAVAMQSVKYQQMLAARLPIGFPTSEPLDPSANVLAEFVKLDRATGNFIFSELGAIDNSTIVDGSVTTPKLSNGAVTAAKMEDLAAYSVFANPTGLRQ